MECPNTRHDVGVNEDTSGIYIWKSYELYYGPVGHLLRYGGCGTRKRVRKGPFLTARIKRATNRAIRQHDRRVAKEGIRSDTVKVLNDRARQHFQLKTGRDG